MKLFLDCEFTSFQGHLISMALVSEDGKEFYEVVPFSTIDCHEWVLDNVVPILVKEQVSYETFQTNLKKFLNQYDEVEIVADWPEDFYHFSMALLTGPGEMLDIKAKIRMEIVRRLDYPSVLPHNALEDAKAIKIAYLKRYTI